MADQREQERLLLKVSDVAVKLSVCSKTVRRLVRDGELQSVKIGKARRIPSSALNKYVANLQKRIA